MKPKLSRSRVIVYLSLIVALLSAALPPDMPDDDEPYFVDDLRYFEDGQWQLFHEDY